MPNAPITAIIVTFNSQDVLAGCLCALRAEPEVARIIVVDNCSTDDTCELVQGKFPDVELVENPRNLGFGWANNIGLEKVTTPYALLINPDAVLQQGALHALLKAASRYHDAAILAPQLADGNGHIHKSYKRSVFAREAWRDNYCEPGGDLCAEFLSGAVWLLNIKHMRSVGFFDTQLFLYYEDDDMCLRARRAGFGLVLVQSARAIHDMGNSS
ncbi:MAG: glycosyltransferase family 2 protein, partial [Alphaproteobacteria bacterium]